MLLLLIIICEIAFWLFLLGGLAARYLFHARRLSTLLLAGSPLIDGLLLVATTIDLKSGGTPPSPMASPPFTSASPSLSADRSSPRQTVASPPGSAKRRNLRHSQNLAKPTLPKNAATGCATFWHLGSVLHCSVS